ncbi:MAG: IPT/TIG domain-containing protein [Myxococcaceae bacterium]|nr:IPT/TIG domain-containing protein [Myxococcaceae bacterium]
MSRVMLIAGVLVGCGPAVVAVGAEAPPPALPDEALVATATPAPREPWFPAGDVGTAGAGLFVSRFGPAQGVVGTRVRVLGSGFSAMTEQPRVFFGSVRCGVSAVVLPSSNDGLLEFDVPEGAVTNPLTIAVGGQTVSTAEPFTVLTGPVVWDVDPRAALVNTRDQVIGITGDGFYGSPRVWLDGQPLTVTQVTVGRLTALVPFPLKTVAREAVLEVEGAAETLRFVVENPGPAITSVAPPVLHARLDVLTVAGAGFVPTSTVLVDSQPVPTTWDAGTLVAKLPTLAVGPHLVMVQTPAPGGGVSAAVTVTVE